MLRHWDARSLDDLLAAHGLTGIAEEPFPNDGWSGATLTLLRRGDDRFVLKRTSWTTDWIARATRDHALREGFVAANDVVRDGPVIAPYLGAAADGTALAVLMPDLTGTLVPWEQAAGRPTLGEDAVERVVGAVARLHAAPWAPHPDDWPWCPVRERLVLLTRPSAERFVEDGVAAGQRFLDGWAAFERHAPPDARDLVAGLASDPAPLLDALGGLPAVQLHGDLKLANVALLDDDRIALIDWQMTCRAPVAVELGWLLVSNAQVLPLTPDAVLEVYRAAAARLGSAGEGPVGDWDAQLDLTWIVGLLLRGWRKGLDAEADVALPSGIAAKDDLVEWSARAVEGAARRL